MDFIWSAVWWLDSQCWNTEEQAKCRVFDKSDAVKVMTWECVEKVIQDSLWMCCSMYWYRGRCFQVECKKAQPKEVMMPATMNRGNGWSTSSGWFCSSSTALHSLSVVKFTDVVSQLGSREWQWLSGRDVNFKHSTPKLFVLYWSQKSSPMDTFPASVLEFLAHDSIWHICWAWYMLSPVCPSDGWILEKWLKLGLWNFHRMVAPSV